MFYVRILNIIKTYSLFPPFKILVFTSAFGKHFCVCDSWVNGGVTNHAYLDDSVHFKVDINIGQEMSISPFDNL